MMTIEKLLDGLMVSVEPFVICRNTTGPVLKFDALEFTSLHYVIAGSGILLTRSGDRIDLVPGSMVIVPAGVAYQLEGTGTEDENLTLAKNCLPLELGLEAVGSTDGEGGIVMACASIKATYQRLHGLFDHLSVPIAIHPRQHETIGTVLTAVLNEMANPQPGSNALIALLMKQVLVYLLRQYCESGNCQVAWLSALEDPQLAGVLEQMIDEPGRRFSLELLADSAGMSRSAFAQRFKAAFGRSPMDFLKELRLQRAAQLLKTSDRPVKSIADQVGFDSRSHFSRSFTDYYGSSPAEFREGASL